MTRWKASFIHVLISLAIVGTVASYIIYFWYPPALIHMAKADKLLMLIGGVDLVIGPLLTLIVFKPGKPSLKFDLSVIALLQIGFLSFGLHSIYASRPVFIVASSIRFDMVFANEISEERLAKASDPRFASLGFAKPVLVGAKMPSEPEIKQKILYSALSGAGDLETMPQYYVEYQQIVPDLMRQAMPVRSGAGMPDSVIRVVEDAAAGYGKKPDEVRVLRLGSSRGFALMLVEAGTGKVVGPVDVDY